MPIDVTLPPNNVASGLVKRFTHHATNTITVVNTPIQNLTPRWCSRQRSTSSPSE